MINEKFYTKAGIQNYIDLIDIQTQRGQLVATLNHQLASITNTLSAPIQNLSLTLHQHSKSEDTQDKN